MKHTFTLQSSIIIREIDICVNEIQKFLQLIVETIVSWAIFNRYVKSFQNKQCNATIKNTRKLRRLWSTSQDLQNLTFYIKINDRKQKIIQKTKRVNFRQKIEKLLKYSRVCDDSSNERRIKIINRKRFLNLIFKFNDQTIETSNERMKMFKSVFFRHRCRSNLTTFRNYFIFARLNVLSA
jgi:hypothetical protein